MRVRLTPQAEDDLTGIAAYLEPRNPLGARHVEAAVQDALAILAQYPEAGYELVEGVRRVAPPRYPYLISYRVNDVAGAVDVPTVRHGAPRDRQSES